ncbi:hypothetical protein [Brevundimonas sp. FT23042]|uniref:hypothetical protein n=1 Tax=Brevundimonas sp. FT23042 TaxID=3393749 RepID=UPI003B588A5F
MADLTPRFETDFVETDRAREQGLGLGERELKAQRDPGGVSTPDVDEDDEPGDPVVRNVKDDPEG